MTVAVNRTGILSTPIAMNAPRLAFGRDTTAASPATVVDLATVAPFRLGPLEVLPSLCRVRRHGIDESIEPRVMQVVVVLAEARGDVVSRQELIVRCWAGRVVGENAINRVVSRVRALGADDFAVETINKVGYRLLAEHSVAEAELPRETGAAPAPVGTVASDRPVAHRRRVLIGGAVAGATLFGVGAGLWRQTRHRPSPEALALCRKGIEAQRQGLAEQNVQAAAYFREAVTRDPDYAAAWGALALAYRHLLETGRPEDDPAQTAAWVRSAARHAMQLDPDNADARVALILIKPYFRNLTGLESEIRQVLKEHPDHWLLWGNLGRILGEAGRWNDAIAPLRQAIALDPFLPLSRARHATTLWASGSLQEAEAAFDEAAMRWPGHPAIWFPRFNFLAFTGRTAAALAMVARTDTRPIGTADDVFDACGTLARACDAATMRATDDVDRAAGMLPTGSAVQYLARLGRLDAAYTRIDAYFGDGRTSTGGVTDPSLTRRYTDFLFLPSADALRADRRFRDLTAAIGLDDYWRLAGAAPDYRRGGSAVVA